MWPWRRRERFSLDELKFLTEQLNRVSVVNEFNKDSVVEILRSLAELIIWGDQRDPSFFEYFMEKQVMVLFLQILELSSNTTAVAVQLLQTLNIMVQNIRNDHAIYYIFSNGYLNHFITYPYNFGDEELLAYYISFLRTTSTKLDPTTISFFITTENDEVVSFPLYTEGIKFFRHEEGMVRIAVRTLTLNVYHVNDDGVRNFVSSEKAVGYIGDIVKFLKEKSFLLHDRIADSERTLEPTQSKARLEGCIAETEEILDYCNDIVSAGIPDLARAMTNNLMHLFVIPLFGSLASASALSALYLLSRVLCLVKHKPLANGIAAALVCESFPDTSPPEQNTNKCDLPRENGVSSLCPMEHVLSHVISDNDKLILASVTFLLALLHNEVDDSILEVLGLLPRLKQHRRRLLQALMGSNSDEDLFGGEDSLDVCDYASLTVESEKTVDGKKLRNTNFCGDTKNDKNAKCNSFVRMQETVVKKLLELLCRRPPPCVEALWQCGALLRQIFPYHQEDNVHSSRIAMIRAARREAKEAVKKELDDCWCDAIPLVVVDVWQTSRKALEGSYYRDESSALLTSTAGSQRKSLDDRFSSSIIADRMQESIQIFLALHQLHLVLTGESVPEVFTLALPPNVDVTAKVGTEVDLSSPDALHCRIAFERGKERDMYLIPTVSFTSGWLVLADGVPPKGIIRVVAPLSGCMPEIDEEHRRWLHLRIRPPQWPHRKQALGTKRTKRIDGRWTLAFPDPQSCEKARDAVMIAMSAQKKAVVEILKPLLDDDTVSV